MSQPSLRLVGKDASSAVRVLVVEDDEDQCALTRVWHAALGCEETSAASPDEALRLHSEERFDILFTDVAMPGSMMGQYRRE